MDDRDSSVWRTVFAAFDRDRSGRIDPGELERALRNLGGEWSTKRIHDAFDGFDADGRGSLSFEQFLALVTGEAPLVNPELVRAFRMMDADGDGVITVGELTSIFDAAGVNAKAEIKEFVDEADGDADGTISFAEFLKVAEKR